MQIDIHQTYEEIKVEIDESTEDIKIELVDGLGVDDLVDYVKNDQLSEVAYSGAFNDLVGSVIEFGSGFNVKLAGRNENVYGSLGNRAWDLSNSFFPGTWGATGYYSFAFGDVMKASGNYSVAMGTGSEALGLYSISLGNSLKSFGLASFTTGLFNTARTLGEISIGAFGTDYTPENSDSVEYWYASDRIFNIGNGINRNSPDDALTVFKSGAIKFYARELGEVTNANDGFFILDENSQPHFYFDGKWNKPLFTLPEEITVHQGGELTIENGGSLIIDNTAQLHMTNGLRMFGDENGLRYTQNFFWNFTERSLIDKGYADASYMAKDPSGIIEVTNGGELKIDSSGIVEVKESAEISLAASSQIKLIDSSLIDLIESSQIKLSQGFQLVGDTTNGLRYPYDLSQGYIARSLVDKGYIDSQSFISKGDDSVKDFKHISVMSENELIELSDPDPDTVYITEDNPNGSTSERPLATVGQQFYDTTLGKPIWFNGVDWTDAMGTVV